MGIPPSQNSDPGCQELCHQNGMAYACFSAFGQCGEVTDGCLGGRMWLIGLYSGFMTPDGTLTPCCLPNLAHPNPACGTCPIPIFITGFSGEYCSDLQPTDQQIRTILEAKYGEVYDCQVANALAVPGCQTYTFATPIGQCTGVTTACCKKNCANEFWGPSNCLNLTPANCSAIGGSWVERYQVGSSFFTNPCGALEICDRQPCCKLSSAPDYDWPPYPTISRMISLCDMRTPQRCDETFPAGHPQQMQQGGRSCWRPRTCVDAQTGIGCDCGGTIDCLGGDANSDFAVTFRPEHHRIDGVPLALDDGELVTKNPQRNIESSTSLEDCKYVYAALGFVEETPGGDAVMAAGCGRVWGSGYLPFLGAAVFREQGDVRFFNSYRARRL